MTAYVIANVEVTDADGYAEYRELAQKTVAAHGGRYVVRGGATKVLEGEPGLQRVVVLVFDSVEDAERWWSSEDYAPAKALRQATARTDMFVVEGV
jgi:uncharacterized protein (DUF1330 family)